MDAAMQPVLIPCPECGKELKLRDRSLLGRRGKCPKCDFRFVLEEPEEVELELADGDTPAVGTSARWVPDEPAEGATQTATVAPARTAEPPPRIQIDDSDEEATSATSRIAERRRKQKKQRMWIILGSTITGVILALVIVNSFGPTRTGNGDGDANTQANANGENGNAGNRSRPPSELAQPSLPPEAPPAGKPIALNFIPTGARMIIHLRPGELWKVNSQAETVRLCLGPLGVWTEKKIKEELLFEPQKIEEALICLFLDDKTRPPDVAYWVKFVEPIKTRSTFIEKFGGQRNDDHNVPIYITDSTSPRPNRAYMITDKYGGSFASVPAAMRADMVLSIQDPGLPHGGLEELLKQTDRHRHLTLLFNPHDLEDFKQYLFPNDLHDVVDQFLLRFDVKDIEAVAWSFHFGSPDYPDFYSDIVLRNQTSKTPRMLQVDMKKRFEQVPQDVAAGVKKMSPTMVAERKLVSRLPLMLQAYHVETVPTVSNGDERYIRLTTSLPGIAGPNLAAAGMLAWRMAGRTDFSKPPPKTGGKKLPEKIADRLKKKIEVDFRRLPLQEAIDYIGGETSVRVSIDGDALKDAGYTKNMPQTFKLDSAPATQAIGKILSQYQTKGKEMVVVVDEAKKVLIVTTKKFAEMKGQKPYPIP